MPAEEIVVGNGCFWCTEAVFQRTPGVLAVKSGYAGGHQPSPSYEQVCSGATGHAEVLKIQFDPAKTTLAKILAMFFASHDPTTLNRQGHDVGTQYRSIILASSPEQRHAAHQAIEAAQPDFKDPIVTEVAMLDTFWEAEPGHQDYFNRNPGSGYCQVNISPKLAKLGLS